MRLLAEQAVKLSHSEGEVCVARESACIANGKVVLRGVKNDECIDENKTNGFDIYPPTWSQNRSFFLIIIYKIAIKMPIRRFRRS